MSFKVSILTASLILLLSAACPVSGQAPAANAIQPVPFGQVSITDSFWAPRIEINRTVTIPSSFQKCEETGRVQNFVLAAKRQGKFLTTFPFDDTDIYKTIEGAAFSMSVHPDAALDRYVDSLITLVAAAQEPDGYLYTARTIDPAHPHEWSGNERWVKESVLSHELYNAGHLYEAATAHYRATGKRNFLDIALRNADLLVKVFGPGPGQRNDAPGHEIVEMGLVSLELPNLTAYNETCAAIANVYWNYRMFLLHGESKYIDVLERSLYNGLISGVGLDGKTFFYPNPLECDASFKFNRGSLTRQPWFDCSCCPTNLCRFLPSVPGYIYAQQQDRIYVNLFVNGTAQLAYAGQQVRISQETRYPWDGQVRIAVTPEKATALALYIRIPGWAVGQPAPGGLYKYAGVMQKGVVVKINGKPAVYSVENGYAVIRRQWKKGDVIGYDLPMSIHRVTADPKVLADTGKMALERGPIVFCFEEVDNKGVLDDLDPRSLRREAVHRHPLLCLG